MVPVMRTTKTGAPRTDKGAPIDDYIAKIKPPLRTVCNALVRTIKAAIPGARGELKWGMPFFCVDGQMIVGFEARKNYLRLSIVPGAKLDDPDGVLYGSGHSRSLKITSTADLTPRLTTWIKATAKARRSADD